MRCFFCLVALFLTSVVQAEDATRSLWDIDTLSNPPQMKWLDSESPIRSMVFTGLEFNSKPTEVFAFYATPGTVSG